MKTGKIMQLQALLSEKRVSCTEITRQYFKDIERSNPVLNAYVRTTEETALAAAERVDGKLQSGEALLPLEGVPMALKDNISTKGIETTCCSKILNGYFPIYDASVWEILQSQNAVLL